ncbi:MAG: aminopeptidase P family protein [Clostridia bacterium]|nr:aminopeptidase P family protein [Clostridia bacterium]
MTKLGKLREQMKKNHLDAVIVFDELNQRYLSDFAFTDGFIFVTLAGAYLVTDFRYYEMALKSVSDDFKVLTPEKRGDFIEEVISSEEIKTVGFEGDFLSYARYIALKTAHPTVGFENIGDMIEQIRQIKTPEEIGIMQKAQDITDRAFEHILKVLDPERMTEKDVAVELEYAMRKNGADGFAFDTIAVSGDASSLPHGTPREVKLKKGFLTMDFGARFDGYCSDMTRTVAIGKADSDMKKIYDTVLRAQTAALEYLRAGVDAGEADKVARDIINVGYNSAFGHSLGHSVGLFIHESPRLSPKSFGYKLREGEILTVEPGIYLFGKYGCRIEDMVKIEENGVYNFTHSPKELVEIY